MGENALASCETAQTSPHWLSEPPDANCVSCRRATVRIHGYLLHVDVRRGPSIEELKVSDISGIGDQPLKACIDKRRPRDRTVPAGRGDSPHTIQPIRATQF